ncbi:MAG: hypothetical protein KF816_02700 [Melioribacteraceae bacterium]|jgi:hypothetical protein|nr:hypothetical protein [Melioribacteraceae bacterium]
MKSKIQIAQLLGIHDGMLIKLINEPHEYRSKFNVELSSRITILEKLDRKVDNIQLFVKSKNELIVDLPVFKKYIHNNGFITVFWPNKDSNTISDIHDDVIQNIARENGLEVKSILSLDDNWYTAKLFNCSKNELLNN